MKRSSHPSLYFSAYPLKALNQESSNKPVQNKSPYLKAILSGKTRSSGNKKNLSVANPEHEAALRYIKESALLKEVNSNL